MSDPQAVGAAVADVVNPGVGGLAGVVADSPIASDLVAFAFFEGRIGNQIRWFHLAGAARLGVAIGGRRRRP